MVMANHGGDSASVDPDRAMPWPYFGEWLCPILPRQTVRGVRAPSHDSAGGRQGNDHTLVTVDDVSPSLDCSGCRIPVLVSAPEG